MLIIEHSLDTAVELHKIEFLFVSLEVLIFWSFFFFFFFFTFYSLTLSYTHLFNLESMRHYFNKLSCFIILWPCTLYLSCKTSISALRISSFPICWSPFYFNFIFSLRLFLFIFNILNCLSKSPLWSQFILYCFIFSSLQFIHSLIHSILTQFPWLTFLWH